MARSPEMQEIHDLHHKIEKRYAKINRFKIDIATSSTAKKIAVMGQKNLMAHMRIAELRAKMEES